MKYLIATLLFIPTVLFAQDNTQFQERCGQEGFACAECETPLQTGFDNLLNQFTVAPGFQGARPWGRSDATPATLGLRENLTAEQALSQITDLFRQQNGGQLNYIVIGESESVQGTSVTNGRLNPRIAIKSPNSELWVTFNTDPADPGFNKLEIMRWNGREARYEFMEMDFTPGHRALDTTGESCMQCHKAPNPRPNWDTYRAWAGIVPARDDMIEAQTTVMPAGYDPEAEGATPASYQGTPGNFAAPATDGRAYLGFLQQVADARIGRASSAGEERRRSSRLALLDIPVDREAGQLPVEVQSLNPDQQIAAIRDRVRQDGFYRIPHYPIAANLNGNFDSKTARYAGSSQLAFDHLSGQNMCRISHDLKQNPNYPRFKNFLAGMAMGCMPELPITYNDETVLDVFYNPDLGDAIPPLTSNSFNAWMSPGAQANIGAFFQGNGSTILRSLPRRDRRPAADFATALTAVQQDTAANGNHANDIKRARQARFLERYLTGAESLTAAQAAPEVQRGTSMFAPRQDNFHAIGDRGGVAGVPEAHASHITALRLALEPFGVNMGDWSLMRGPDSSYDSYAFSDQFVLFFNQPAVREPADEVVNELMARGTEFGPEDVCRELQRRSVAAFGGGPAVVPPAASENVAVQPFDIADVCQPAQGVSIASMADNINVGRLALEPQARQHFKVCAECHDGSMAVPFAGMENWSGDWSEESWARFNSFLLGVEGDQRRPMAGAIVARLNAGEMPMYGWSDHAAGISSEAKRAEEAERRTILANYVSMTVATGGREAALRAVCATNGTERRPEAAVPVVGEQPGSAGAR